MAYAQTKIIWDDQSDITPINVTVEDSIDRPVLFFAFASEKGPEEYKPQVKGENFFNLYGSKPSFTTYGQPLLGAAACINAGGLADCKRVVADDATLANIAVVAKVKKINPPATNSSGQTLWQDGHGGVTTDSTVTGIVQPTQKCQIEYELRAVNLAGNSVKAMAKAFLGDVTTTHTLGADEEYPLFFLADNGRGLSGKRFKIVSDSSQTRPMDYVKYIMTISENGTDLEHYAFTINPDIIESGKNLSLQSTIRQYAMQIRGEIFEDQIDAFIENVAYIAGIPYETFKYADALFGSDLYGKAYDSIVMTGSVQLDTSAGIALVNGSNGDFANAPMSALSYSTQLLKAFNGTDGDEIYDTDNFRIDAVFDCNYPAPVKRAIEDLAAFRQDFMYFRDMGTGLESIEEIKFANTDNLKSKFCSTYHNSWDIIDPYTRKEITVTATYSLIEKFVKHFLNGVSRPFCGQQYGVTWTKDDVIEGTVNFNPKNTPAMDQKQWFDDNRINYVSYYNGLLSMESQYTSQERYTQLSWLSNVLNVQSIIREIRVQCPKNRYKYIDTKGLANYQKDVQTLLNKHSADFQEISLVYAKDSNYENNKIYYAYIYVRFKNFVQSEIFRITALKTNDNTSASV